MAEITFNKAERLNKKPQDSELTFGTVFTDYMFIMDYSPAGGCENP